VLIFKIIQANQRDHQGLEKRLFSVSRLWQISLFDCQVLWVQYGCPYTSTPTKKDHTESLQLLYGRVQQTFLTKAARKACSPQLALRLFKI